ncbi:MAG: fibronectin type III domain-containing protein, partial [Armatimonadetes bacterium]|nr:fibronectin type III domain-containing protein [Armatimonadota bacterium]
TASALVTVTGDLSANLRPTLLPEPPWTKGTENRLDWTGVAGATGYELEWSRGTNFGVIVGSLVTPDLTGLATGLSHNVTYYYHVRGLFGRLPDGATGKLPGLPGPWSNVEFSTQDARAPESSFTAPADPLRSNTARTRLPWTSTESGSGFANMSLWYSFEGSVLTRYPGRWQADSVTPGAGENEETATGTLVFDVAQAAGDGSYELWLSGRDNVTNDEATTGYRDLRLIVDSTAPQITDIVVSNITTDSADISWKTSERCTCELTYGEVTADAHKLSTGPGKNHQVHLTGLTPDTEYRFEITATDDFGNTAKSEPQTFRTALPPPPVISNIQVTNITKDSADISWDTDKPTTGLVDYGKTTAYGSQVSDPTWATSHSVHLSGLDWGTLYHFEITATDDYGSTAKSGDQTFTTVQPLPPVISNIQVTNIQRDSADISWETDKLTTGVVYYGTTISYGSQVSDPTLSKKHQVHLSNLPWGTLHHFRISATDQLGLSGWSPDQTFTTLQPQPPVIYDIRVTDIGPRRATVMWMTDKSAACVLDYGPTTAYGSTVVLPREPKFHKVYLHGLTPDVLYHFRITATDSLGLSSQSEDQTFRTPPAVPRAPVLASEPAFTKGTTNTLSWTAVEWAVKYRLEVSRSDTSWPFAPPIDVEGLSATVRGLEDGATYYYRVTAANSVGQGSPPSNVEHSTQDASPPETHCELVSAPTAAPAAYIELVLQGSDASSGVQYIVLHYAKDRGLWQQYPGRRAPGDHVRLDLSKLGGGHYAFYTIGMDNVGNREGPPTTPDVEVDVRVPTTLTYAGDYGTTTGQNALIAGVLTDAFGKPITGATVNYALGSLSGALSATDSHGLAQAVINVPLAPGAYDLTLTYAGTITLAPCSTKIVFVVKPVVSPPGPRVDVVGQGKVVDPAGAQYAFSLNVSSNPLGGTVRVTVGAKVIRATSITSVSAVGNVATITGIATIDGVPGYRFVIRVADGAPDQFGMTTTDGTYVGLTNLSSGGVTITSTP